MDAYLRLREPQQAEGPELSQPSCSSTGFLQGGAERDGRGRGGACCYESSPRELSARAPPLRIHDQIVLVTTSSFGRCWVLQRIECCEKQLWCSLILPTRITGKQLSQTISGMALNICMLVFCLHLICLFSIDLSSHLNVP